MSLNPLAAPAGVVSAGAGVRRIVLAVLAVVSLAAVVLPGVASAAQSRNQVSTFNGSGSDAGAFSNLGRIAVHQGSGTVYAIDANAGVVGKFDASGVAQDFSALGSSSLDGNAVTAPDGPVTFSIGADSDIAVDNSGTASDGNLVVLSEGQQTAWVFDSAGTYLHRMTGFGDPCGTGVDPDGNIWISDYAAGAISQYSAAGVATGVSVNTSAQGSPCHLDFDANGDLYVALYNGKTLKYTVASGYTTFTEVDITPQGTQSVTVDRATHQVYVTHFDSVSAYDAAGAHLYDFAAVPGSIWAGVAINQTADQVYVSSRGTQRVHIFGPAVIIAAATTGDASDLQLTAATLNGTVNPGGIAVSDCHFDYGIDTGGNDPTYDHSAPCVPAAASIPADTDDHLVSADISGLVSGETYRFRLVLTNADGTVEGNNKAFTATGAKVSGSKTEAVGLDSATVRAQINPNGQATTYHADYGTDSGYGQSTPESASIGSNTTARPVSSTLAGLTAGTTYHWRMVATNAAGTVNGPDNTFTTHAPSAPTAQSCANGQFRTGHGASLPDCRAYEQASPANKNGNDPGGGSDYVAAADDGNGITFPVQGGIPGGVGAQNFPIYLARRDAGAWSTAGIFPPIAYGEKAEVLGWTRDLSTAFSFGISFGTSTSTLLARDSANGSFETLVPSTPESNIFTDAYAYAGASEDGSKVYFEKVATPLTPDAIPNVSNLYVLDRASGAVSLAGVLPDGSVPPAGSFSGRYARRSSGPGDPGDGGALARTYTQDNHAISDDGANVFFTAGETNQLYVRRDAATSDASSVHLSASQKTNGAGPGGTDPDGPQPAAFEMATPDASTVLFSSQEELTNDAHTGPTGAGNDLYAYDLASGELTDLTPDSDDVNGADVQGVIGMSDDASYVYFAANGVLADGAAPGACTRQGNAADTTCNLYVWHDGEIDFLALLTGAADTRNWQTSRSVFGPTGRVTPDGRTLLIRSDRQLTAYDNSTGCRGGYPDDDAHPSIQPCSELYRYRVGEPGPTCVSCDPSGAEPTLEADVRSVWGPLSNSPAALRTRNLSASGDRVFFESGDPLVPGDTNGVRDVYVWQAEGSGTCDSAAQNGGCLYLLSTGRSPSPSYFGDASVSGDDVFFFTDSKLVSGDEDSQLDIYDARVGGGLASQQRSVQTPCSGDACRPPVTVTTPAGSVSFGDSGNVDSPAMTSVSVSRLRAVTGSVAKLRIKVPRAGRISVSGPSLKAVRRSVSRGATYTVTVRLSAKAKRALKHDARLKTKVRVAFTPRTGAPASTTMTLSFKPVSKGGH